MQDLHHFHRWPGKISWTTLFSAFNGSCRVLFDGPVSKTKMDLNFFKRHPTPVTQIFLFREITNGFTSWLRNLFSVFWFFEHHPKEKSVTHDRSVGKSEWFKRSELRKSGQSHKATKETPLPLCHSVFWSRQIRKISAKVGQFCQRIGPSTRSDAGQCHFKFHLIGSIWFSGWISKVNFLKATYWGWNSLKSGF